MLLCTLLGVDFIVSLLISILVGIAAEIWRLLFQGTIYGKVVLKNGDVSPQPLENIEISWNAGSATKPCTPVFTNSEGEYRFERDVPVGHYLSMTAKYGKHNEIRENVGEIEDVKWLFGIEHLGLPISSGAPKRVDFTIHPTPPTAAT